MDLHTQRITLRAPIPDDDETLVYLFTDPETMRHLPVLLNQPWDVPRMAARREARAQEEVLGRARNFTIATPGQAVIGHAVYKRLWEDETLKKRGEVGLILDHAHQGRGLVWDVHLLLLTLGFEELGLEIVEWITGRENEGMRAVLSKMGCQDAGVWVEDGDHNWVKYILEKKDWVDCKRWLSERVDRLAGS